MIFDESSMVALTRVALVIARKISSETKTILNGDEPSRYQKRFKEGALKSECLSRITCLSAVDLHPQVMWTELDPRTVVTGRLNEIYPRPGARKCHLGVAVDLQRSL